VTEEDPDPDRPELEDLLDDPELLDTLRRLGLLNDARNLRRRAEADLERGRAAAQQGDREAEWGYLQRALWNLRAGHRLQQESVEGVLEPSPTARPSLDLEYHYRGFGDCPSYCRIRVFEPRGGPVIVLATELTENPGTSITNFVEGMLPQVARLLATPVGELFWIEHYLARGTQPHERETFSQVTLTVTEWGVTRPHWAPLTRAEVEARIGGRMEEGGAQWKRKPGPHP
jgi:hypothetical protein